MAEKLIDLRMKFPQSLKDKLKTSGKKNNRSKWQDELIAATEFYLTNKDREFYIGGKK